MSATCQVDSLTELLGRWGLWRREQIGNRETKVPYSIGGRKASVTDLSAWGDYEAALCAFRAHAQRYSGLAFLFVKGDGFVGLDLDYVLDTAGDVKPWGRGMVERFSDTYCEISPSGKGLKLWARGALPENVPGVKVGDGSIEMYDHARYFTVTGQVFRGAPLQVEDHAADLLTMYGKLTQKVRKVWPLQPLDGGRIPHGQQHSTLVSIAGTLRARRVCEQAILACLLAINEHQLERPAPAENIARIVRSTASWGKR